MKFEDSGVSRVMMVSCSIYKPLAVIQEIFLSVE
jgi:hypothetical protein